MAYGITNSPYRTLGQQNFAKPVRAKSAVPSYRSGGLAQAAPDIYPVGGSSMAPQPGIPSFFPVGGSSTAPQFAPSQSNVKPVAPVSPVSTVNAYTTTPAPTVTQKTATAAPANFDYQSDPILAQIRNSQQGYVASSATSADEARKRLLTDYGSADLARQTIFGAPGVQLQDAGGNTTWSLPDTQMTGDEATALAAQGNPLSTLAQLLSGHQQRDLGITENLNKGNLLFSSSFGQQHGLESQNYAGQQATAASQARDALAAITQQLLAAEQSGIGGVQQGEADAYNRAIQIALTNALNGSTAPAGGAGKKYGGGSDIVDPLAPTGPTPAALAALPRDPALYAVSAQDFKRRQQANSPGGRGGV